MKLPRSTLFLIFLAVSLGSFVYFYEIKNKTAQQQIKIEKSKIFTFTADDVQSLTVKTKNLTVELIRKNPNTTVDKKPDQKPQWEIKSPVSGLANDAIVSYLMDLLVDGKIQKTTSVLPTELSEFGLDQPLATIDITLKNRQIHQLILGKADFNNEFIYAKADPDQNTNLLLISKNFANAVNRDLSEWQQSGENQSDNSKNSQSQPLPSLPSLPPLTATPTPVISPSIIPTPTTSKITPDPKSKTTPTTSKITPDSKSKTTP